MRLYHLVILLALMGLCLGGPLPADAQTCSNPTRDEGAVIYNKDQHVLQYCNGSGWLAAGKAGSGSGSCANPAGPEGAIVYNSDFHTYQFCNGSGWAAFTSGPYGGCSGCTILGNAVPANSDNNEGSPLNVGMIFYSDVAGQVTGIRFYKSTANTGTHIGVLWDINGTKLAQVTFTGGTSSGWQSMTFASPVSITANTMYVASYYSAGGHYADGDSSQDFNTTKTNGPLHGIVSGYNGYVNGVFAYNNGVIFPEQTYQASNYFVDVLFSSN